MNPLAFRYLKILVPLFVFLGHIQSHATEQNTTPFVPQEIRFANITFQLTDVTRYLLQKELKNIQANKQILRHQLDRFNLFLPLVEPLLKEAVIPEDFKFLLIYNQYQDSIETSIPVENDVYWCLDKAKAEEVDLIINDQLDERKHLIAATKGAVICLQRNQVLYKNWAATLFSHIADKKILSFLDINKKWTQNPYILLDTPAYAAVLQFLAYKIAIEREFPVYKPAEQKIVYEYPYSKGKTLSKIALDLKVDPATLSIYNQWLKSLNVPDTDCNVLVIIPANRYNEIRTLAEFSKKIMGLPAKDLGFPMLKREESLSKTKGKGGVFYQINDLQGLQADMCDLPVTMAYKAGIPIERFLEYNDIKENDVLSIGQVYYIQPKANKASVPFHIVRAGETLWDISQIYGVKLSNLLNFNRFETVQRLQRGRMIWLQTARPKNKPIEYIEIPDELTEVENIVASQANKIAKQPMRQDSLVRSKTEAVAEEIMLMNLPLSQEIGKGNQVLMAIDKTESTSIKNNSIVVPEIEKNKVSSEHIVKRGETLFSISVNYNVSVSALWVWNNLTTTIVQAGKALKIKP